MAPMASVCRGEAATAAGQDKPTPVDAEMMQPNLPFFIDTRSQRTLNHFLVKIIYDRFLITIQSQIPEIKVHNLNVQDVKNLSLH